MTATHTGITSMKPGDNGSCLATQRSGYLADVDMRNAKAEYLLCVRTVVAILLRNVISTWRNIPSVCWLCDCECAFVCGRGSVCSK